MLVKLWKKETVNYYGNPVMQFSVEKDSADAEYVGRFKPKNAMHIVASEINETIRNYAMNGWGIGDEEQLMKKDEGCTREYAEYVLKEASAYSKVRDAILSACETEEEKGNVMFY